eukprot:m.149988 g.149988  ORF g.149988 m.149988 type:complete len:254 (+) comp17825_c0_seq26:1576-2337(+)
MFAIDFCTLHRTLTDALWALYRGYNHETPVPYPTLLIFMLHTAKGLQYLTDHGILHRDIAARNMLLHVRSKTDFVVKVADFGLSKIVARACVDDAVTESMTMPIPTRWTALEALYKGQWSSMTDVWSWGVMVWELTTHCQFPYTLIWEDKDTVNLIKQGMRLHHASLLPDWVYKLLSECWLTDPKARPAFASIVARVTDGVNALTADFNEKDDKRKYDVVPATDILQVFCESLSTSRGAVFTEATLEWIFVVI